MKGYIAAYIFITVILFVGTAAFSFVQYSLPPRPDWKLSKKEARQTMNFGFISPLWPLIIIYLFSKHLYIVYRKDEK